MASGCSKCKDHIALQLAISCRTGFGQPRSLERSLDWLEKSGKSSDDFDFQLTMADIWILPPAINKRIGRLRHEFFQVDQTYESSMIHGTDFSQLKEELSQELRDIGDSFGQTHPMTITLKRILAQMLNGHGLYNEAAEMQESLIRLLKLAADKDNEMKVLADLCSTYSFQDRLHLAERYRSEVADYFTKYVGEEHMGTLSSLTNLAHTQKQLGMLKKAEKNLLRVIAVRARVAGNEHDSTLGSKSVLVGVYCKQNQYAKPKLFSHKYTKLVLEHSAKILSSRGTACQIWPQFGTSKDDSRMRKKWSRMHSH